MPTVEVLGELYGFRRVTRREIKELDALYPEDVFGFEDALCEMCVIEVPSDFPGWDDCLAGLPTTLTQTIMQESGFTDDSADFQHSAIEWAESPEGRLDTLIAFCFPSVSLSAMDDMDPELYCRYAASARLIVTTIYGMDPSSFLNPDYVPPPQAPPQPEARPKSYAPGY